MAGANQIDRAGRQISRVSSARRLVSRHKAALQARRGAMLIWEKLLLHIDGSGDFQWADILDNSRVEIPRIISEYRKQENLMRIVCENAVAHHTTMPFRFWAESMLDRRSRESALIDTIWANNFSYEQDLNGVAADALGMAMATGFVPIHGYWRDDVAQDWYESVGMGAVLQEMGIVPGMIDVWVGNPFDHVFDRSAKKGSFRWQSYARLVSADAVRAQFDHVPAARSLEGSTRVPSTAEFQRIARSWDFSSLGLHGSPIIQSRRDDEELMTLLCCETAPGVDPDWPDGHLEIVAVPGPVDLYRGETGAAHNVVPLADQPLPAGDFSSELLYSHQRVGDIHGKPWAEDIDPLQVDLNLAKSKRWENIIKMGEAPIVAPAGAIGDDMTDMGGYNLLELEPSLAAWRPAVMQWPSVVIQALDKEIEDLRRAIYTIGGYQSVSRGESPGSRTPFRAIQALQQADRSIHTPVNLRFKRGLCNFMRRMWRQMKTYGDVPWIMSIVGDDFAHLVEPYVDKNMLSTRPPQYKMINAFGTTLEGRAEEILELMQQRGGDGMPFLRTDEARRAYPDQSLFDDMGNPGAIQRRRARTVAKEFETYAVKMRQSLAQQGNQNPLDDPADPQLQMAARQLFMLMEKRFKRLRDDDLNAHLAAYTEIIQDETADPIAREALVIRQSLYYDWQAAMAAQAAPAPEGEGGGEKKQLPPGGEQ